jgi:hypothetical protein
MMGERTVAQDALFSSSNLERHVSADDLLRSIDPFVDLSAIREHLRPCYSGTEGLEAIGRDTTGVPAPSVRDRSVARPGMPHELPVGRTLRRYPLGERREAEPIAESLNVTQRTGAHEPAADQRGRGTVTFTDSITGLNYPSDLIGTSHTPDTQGHRAGRITSFANCGENFSTLAERSGNKNLKPETSDE